MKLTYDFLDYEYAVSKYGDLELTFHKHWKIYTLKNCLAKTYIN